jgi:hypothetical protein
MIFLDVQVFVATQAKRYPRWSPCGKISAPVLKCFFIFSRQFLASFFSGFNRTLHVDKSKQASFISTKNDIAPVVIDQIENDSAKHPPKQIVNGPLGLL